MVETSGWDSCVQEGPPCVLNVFQAELMSPTRSERCARCMCHVCTYKPAPLAVLLATLVTHSEPVLPRAVLHVCTVYIVHGRVCVT